MRILVIEDDHKIATAIKKGLKQESYAVDLAFTGTEGYDLASSETYDIILLDLMIPGMNGLDVCRNLRQADIHTPILMLTAKGQTNDKVTGLNAGADDYLTKPFAFEELLARIKALNRRPKDAIGAKLTYADLTLDTLSYQVERSGKTISLSTKEYALLEYLLRHPEHVLTKNQIIEHVWNYEADVLPNTVEVYIGYLRNKIDKPFRDRPSLIQTVRGFGYTMRKGA